MSSAKAFYNRIANYYHLIYANWDESVVSSGIKLSAIIQSYWNQEVSKILDCTCGIGTQALGLAMQGYEVTGSDLSDGAIKRAAREARKRKLIIPFSVCDIRNLWKHYQREFDLVISCDNSLPHLLNSNDITKGLQEMYKCTRIGGGCLISIRDYEREKQENVQTIHYGTRFHEKNKYIVFQVREFKDEMHYTVSLFFVQDSGTSRCKTFVARTCYFTLTIPELLRHMEQVGFTNIQCMDEGFSQPVIIGRKL